MLLDIENFTKKKYRFLVEESYFFWIFEKKKRWPNQISLNSNHICLLYDFEFDIAITLKSVICLNRTDALMPALIVSHIDSDRLLFRYSNRFTLILRYSNLFINEISGHLNMYAIRSQYILKSVNSLSIELYQFSKWKIMSNKRMTKTIVWVQSNRKNLYSFVLMNEWVVHINESKTKDQ